MKAITVKAAPDAIGPYCHAMKSGNLVFCSGQTPLDPKTMTLVGTTIEEQTKSVLNNLSIVLSEMGLTLQDVVKTTTSKTSAHGSHCCRCCCCCCHGSLSRSIVDDGIFLERFPRNATKYWSRKPLL